jgi:hypothetical protein
MTKLDALIQSLRSANCPVGGDPISARWWDLWLETFWTFDPLDHEAWCEPRLTHDGRLSWHETEMGIIGVPTHAATGHYWIPNWIDFVDQATDDAWFACCDDDRTVAARAMSQATQHQRAAVALPAARPRSEVMLVIAGANEPDPGVQRKHHAA